MLNNRKSINFFNILNNTFMFIFMLSIIGPFVYVILVSITNQTSINLMFIERNTISLDSYIKLFTMSSDIFRSFLVSFFRTTAGTILNLVFTCMFAYPLSKKILPGKTLLVFFIALTLLFSGGLIPAYLVISKLKLIDNYLVYVLPTLLSAWYVLILRNFFMSIPDSFEESAKIDGCSELIILIKIIIPLSIPALATLGVFYAINHWNAWFDAVIYIRDSKKWSLQMLLRIIYISSLDSGSQLRFERAGTKVTPESIKSAMLIITVLPIVIVYPFLQKYFVKGIMIGGIKG